MDAPGDLPFPHVSQAYLIERHMRWTRKAHVIDDIVLLWGRRGV
jgi:hypothetical protein